MTGSTLGLLAVGAYFVLRPRRSSNGVTTVPADQTFTGFDIVYGKNSDLPPASVASGAGISDIIDSLFSNGSPFGCVSQEPGKSVTENGVTYPCRVVTPGQYQAAASGAVDQ